MFKLLKIKNFSGVWRGQRDTLFASVRLRNSASNDKYTFAHAVNRSYNFLVKQKISDLGNLQLHVCHSVQHNASSQTFRVHQSSDSSLII